MKGLPVDPDKSFLGTGWAFPPEFDRRTKATKTVSEEADIQESLRILFSTSPGERVMHPTYGCGLRAMIFENINESTITEIKDMVERAILFFEPRITLNFTDVDASRQHEGVLMIRVDYTIKTTNSRGNMVYPFYFREGTLIGT